MKFNHGTDSLYADALYFAGASATDFPIAAFTRLGNAGLDRVTSLIQRSDTTWEWDDDNQTDLPIAVTDMTASRADYSLAVTHLKVLRVRVMDQSGNWITLDPVSRRDLSDAELAATGTPQKYDKLGSSIFLYPKPSYGASGGIEVQFQRPASYFEITDTAKEPGFAAQFHRLISLHAAADFCDANGKDQRAASIRKRIESLETELVEFYADRDRDHEPSMSVERTIENF